MNRREFTKKAALVGAITAIIPISALAQNATPKETGIISVRAQILGCENWYTITDVVETDGWLGGAKVILFDQQKNEAFNIAMKCLDTVEVTGKVGDKTEIHGFPLSRLLEATARNKG